MKNQINYQPGTQYIYQQHHSLDSPQTLQNPASPSSINALSSLSSLNTLTIPQQTTSSSANPSPNHKSNTIPPSHLSNQSPVNSNQFYNQNEPQGILDQLILQTNNNNPILIIKNLIEQNKPSELQNYILSLSNTNMISEKDLTKCLSFLLPLYHKDSIPFLDCLEILLINDADVNTKFLYNFNINGTVIQEKITLIMFSVLEKNMDMIKIILRYKPNLELKDSKNRNALIYGVLFDIENDNYEIVELLLKNGADANACFIYENYQVIYERTSALILAVMKGNLDYAKLLIKYGADVNCKLYPNEDSCLHIAVNTNNYEMVKFFLFEMGSLVPGNPGESNNNVGFKINTEMINKNHLKAFELAKDKNKDIYELFIKYYQESNIKNNSITPINNINNINNINSLDNVNINTNNINAKCLNLNQHITNMSSKSKYLNFNPDLIKNIKSDMQSIVKNVKNNNKQILDIPVELKKHNKKNPELHKNLKNYISFTKTPTLSIDLNDKSLKIELEINDVLQKIKEANDNINQFTNLHNYYESRINELTNEIKNKEKDLSCIKEKENNNAEKIKELLNKKNEIISQIPKDKLNQESKKNLPLKELRELKFSQESFNEAYITHTLQKDLIDYALYINDKIVNKKSKIIDIIYKEIKNSISEMTMDYDLVIDGSYATNLCLPWSDLNLLLINKKINATNNNGNMNINNNVIRALDSNQKTNILKNIFYSLKNKSFFAFFKILEISNTQLLHITCTDEYERLIIDIKINDESYFGLKYVELINSYLKEYKILRPIILALKTILKNSNLHNPLLGGLSSYGLILMIVSFIQSKIDNQESDLLDCEDSIGKLFYGFLYHYGIFFDFGKYVILTYPINDKNNDILDNNSAYDFGENSHELIIVDPLNKKNNVAKETSQFMNLKMAFMIAYMVTRESCDCGCHYGKAAHENNNTSAEHCILKRMFNSVKRFSDNSK